MSSSTISDGNHYPTNPSKTAHELQGSVVGARCVDRAFMAHLQLTALEAVALDGNGVHAAITLPAAGTTVVTTGITNPPYPRNLTVVGNEADVTGNVVIAGTNEADEEIEETFALNGTTTVEGNYAFKTVTSITVPARQDADETVEVGWGDKIGLPHLLTHNTLRAAFINNVEEITAPTVATDADELHKNTVLLDSALAGTVVDLYYWV